jgi:hypothetical protein
VTPSLGDLLCEDHTHRMQEVDPNG